MADRALGIGAQILLLDFRILDRHVGEHIEAERRILDTDIRRRGLFVDAERGFVNEGEMRVVEREMGPKFAAMSERAARGSVAQTLLSAN
jgi:hypothetical protein